MTAKMQKSTREQLGVARVVWSVGEGDRLLDLGFARDGGQDRGGVCGWT